MFNTGHQHTSIIQFSPSTRWRMLEWLWKTHGSPHAKNFWWMSVSASEPRVIVVSFKDRNNKLVFDLVWSGTYTIYSSMKEFDKQRLLNTNSGA